MKLAVITGHCSAIGRSTEMLLHERGYDVIPWCRHHAVDLAKQVPILVVDLDAVIHIAEIGPEATKEVFRHTIPLLQARRGAFIFISSIHLIDHDDAYGRSKRLQEEFLLSQTRAAAPARVNCLRLGHIAGTRAWPQEDPRRVGEVPLGRFGSPPDVAYAIAAMLTLPWLTGSVVTLDGGISSEIPK